MVTSPGGTFLACLPPLGADDRYGHRVLRQGSGLCLAARIATVLVAYTLLALTIMFLWPILRKEFFPEVDAGSFEMYVRGPSGLRIEKTEERIEAVDKYVREVIDKEDLQLVLSELGVTPDWSAAYTPNAGPMDAVVKIQLTAERRKSAQEYVAELRQGFTSKPEFSDLEFAFDAGWHGSLGNERGQVHANKRPSDCQGPGGRAPRGLARCATRSLTLTAWWTLESSRGWIIRST